MYKGYLIVQINCMSINIILKTPDYNFFQSDFEIKKKSSYSLPNKDLFKILTLNIWIFTI